VTADGPNAEGNTCFGHQPAKKIFVTRGKKGLSHPHTKEKIGCFVSSFPSQYGLFRRSNKTWGRAPHFERAPLETAQSPDFASLAVRLASFGHRVFAEFGLGGLGGTVRGIGLSIEDFVGNVLSEHLEGRLAHEASRGELFSLLATAMRNDIIDALRRAAHTREEGRSPVRRERSEVSPALDELPARAAEIAALIDEGRYRRRVREAFSDEPDLADVVRAVLDLDLSKPQEIAEALGISADEVQNRKKRLRRRLVEYGLVAGRQQ